MSFSLFLALVFFSCYGEFHTCRLLSLSWTAFWSRRVPVFYLECAIGIFLPSPVLLVNSSHVVRGFGFFVSFALSPADLSNRLLFPSGVSSHFSIVCFVSGPTQRAVFCLLYFPPVRFLFGHFLPHSSASSLSNPCPCDFCE